MSKDTKERILESALELFAQNGYTGTSMSEIANKLGVTKAALYKHFIGNFRRVRACRTVENVGKFLDFFV